MRRFLVAFVVLSLRAPIVIAGDLSLDLHELGSPTVNDVPWNTNNSSPTMVVGIDNTTSTTTPLVAWQLGLEIVPTGTGVHTGGLLFAGAEIPSSGYLLDGRSSGLSPALSGPTNTIGAIGDIDSLYTGVIVPSTGDSLLQLSFSALPRTSGDYEINVVPGPDYACWFSDDFEPTGFLNAPFSGGPVTLGYVEVVPEPGTLALFGSGGMAMAMLGLRRWRRRRPNPALPTLP